MLDHVKTVSDSIQIACGVLSTLTINPAKMQASLDPFMLVSAPSHPPKPLLTIIKGHRPRRLPRQKGCSIPRDPSHLWTMRSTLRKDRYSHERDEL